MHIGSQSAYHRKRSKKFRFSFKAMRQRNKRWFIMKARRRRCHAERKSISYHKHGSFENLAKSGEREDNYYSNTQREWKIEPKFENPATRRY